MQPPEFKYFGSGGVGKPAMERRRPAISRSAEALSWVDGLGMGTPPGLRRKSPTVASGGGWLPGDALVEFVGRWWLD
jgi:hypothetical protein